METWLWTGPLGHFVGGAFDLAEALARHGLARVWSAIRPALARSPSR
jgi:hypothetical protein